MPIETAIFQGVVDVPLFNAPDLSVTDYTGFESSPRFVPGAQVPQIQYKPRVVSTNDRNMARMISTIPTLNGQNQLLINPTASDAGSEPTDYNVAFVDGFNYVLDSTANTGGGLIYNWHLFRSPQYRAAGDVTPALSRWYLTNTSGDYSNTGISLFRLEFTDGVKPGADFMDGNVPMLPFNFGNVYSRVYAMVLTDAGLQRRNCFNTNDSLPLNWILFKSGSMTAFCRPRVENEIEAEVGYGGIAANVMFVSKGTKQNAWIVIWRTHDFDPDTIEQQPPQAAYEVTFDNAAYASALNNPLDVQAWHTGFSFTLQMDGTGVTGQKYEIVVTDYSFRKYWVMRLVPQTAQARAALQPTNVTWTAKIDVDGTIWFYNPGAAGFKDAIFNSFSPGLFFSPWVINPALPPLTLPCYNTCLPGTL